MKYTSLALLVPTFVLTAGSIASAQPTLVSARRSFVDHTQVKVVFSEPVTEATAANASNYGINNGVEVSAAGIGAEASTVILVTSPIVDGPAYILTVSGVQNGGGQPITPNSPIAIQTSPLVPLDFGTMASGFQDDFSSATRDTNWVAAIPGGDPFTQANGVLVAGVGPYESPHLLYDPIDTPYNDSTQEILARIRIISDSLGYDFNYGVSAGVAPNTAQGQHLIFRNNAANSPPDFPLRHFLFVRFGINWGPGIYEPDATTPKTWQKETWYWLRLRQEFNGDGTNDGFAKVWVADGDTPEPANWSQVYDFAEFIDEVRTGFAGVGAAKMGSPGEARFDYVLIKADGLPSITPSAQAFSAPAVAHTLTITQQPQNATTEAGLTAAFSVSVSSSWPVVFYQWQKKVGSLWQPVGSDINNYTTPTLLVADSGTKYRVVVSVPGTNVVSSEATLTVPPVSIVITQQPQNATVEESTTATFTVTSTNSANLTATYQWQRQEPGGGSWTDIASAIQASYTTPPLTIVGDNGAKYRVVVSIPGNSKVSDEATLMVGPNTSKPTLVSARRLVQDPTKVTVVLSEAVSPTVSGNYTISGGTAVTGAVMGSDTRTVVLTVSPAIPDGATRTLTVSGVQDLFGNTIVADSMIAISLAPLAPNDLGTTVNGYQDDFFNASLNPDWIGTPGSFAESGQAFTQIGSGVAGYLQVGKANREAPTLQYRPAGGYDLINQEVLARVQLTGIPDPGESGDALKAGVGVSGNPVSSDSGIYAEFRNKGGGCGSPGGFPQRHAQFHRPSLAWGPGINTDTGPFTWSNDTWYWIRLRQEFNSTGPDALVKIWPADGDTPEPETWGGGWDFASTIDGMREGYAGIVAGSTISFACDGLAPIPDEYMKVDYVLIKSAGLPSIVVSPIALDTIKPTLVSARRLVQDPTKVTVVLSEAVSPTVSGNYTINGGTAVTAAVMGSDTRTVVLTVSPAIPDGANRTLTVNGVQDLAGNTILANSMIAISLAPLAPNDLGTTVNGYQDDFYNASLNPDWIGTPGSFAESGQAFTQIGSGVAGYLQVGKANREAPTLQYRPAGGYDLINQEVLARVQLTGVPDPGESGDALKAGVGVSGNPVSSDSGIYAEFRNKGGGCGSPGGFPQRHAQFHRPSLAWGPGINTDTGPFTWSNDTWYWIRLRQEFNSTGPDALVKIWPADGDTPEPETWGGGWDFASTIDGMRQGYAGIVAGSTISFACDGLEPIPDEYMKVDYVLIKSAGLPSIVVSPIALDTIKPTLVSARRLVQDPTKVTVVLSEAVSPTVSGNYTINGGTAVTAAVMGSDTRTVVLTVSPAIPDGANRTLTVNGVQDLAGNTILANSMIAISLAPLAPNDLGTTVNGYQDDFYNASLNPDWIGTPGSFAESGQAFTQIGSGVAGYLQVGKANREAPTLQYRPAGGYDLINQEVLARVQLTGVPDPGESGDALKAGVGVSGNSFSSDSGIYAEFRNKGGGCGSPGGFPQRHAQFHRPSLAWGPGINTDTGPFTWSNDTWYWIRLRQEFNSTGPDALVKIWPADGDTPEPETWGGGWDFASTIDGMREGYAGIVAGSTQPFACDGLEPIPDEYMKVDYVLIKSAGLPSIVVQPNAFDNIAPGLVAAELDFFNPSSQIIVTFSEAIDPGLATYYSINNGVTVNSASQGTSLNTVVLGVSGLASGVYTLTVNNVLDLAGNVIAPNSQVAINTVLPPPRKQDTGPDALLVLEAEHANRNISAGGTTWTFTTADPGFSGVGAMQALPNSGRNVNINTAISPRLDFRVLFNEAGTYYIWVRGLGDSAPGPSADDSVNVGLDDLLPSTSDRIANWPQGAGFVWSQSTLDGAPATFDVPTPGEHVVTIWMREDGFIVDKLLLTKNAAYVPMGLDAPESSIDLPEIAIAPQGANLVVTWTVSAILQSASAVTGPWDDVVGATSPYIVVPTDQAYFRLRR